MSSSVKLLLDIGNATVPISCLLTLPEQPSSVSFSVTLTRIIGYSGRYFLEYCNRRSQLVYVISGRI